MSTIIGLDFETYGAVNLPVHGLERYVAHPSFRPLIASIAFGSDPRIMPETKRLDFVEDYEGSLRLLKDLVESCDFIAAHNAGFEWRVLKELGIDVSASKFIDSAVVARAAGAGGSLEAAAPQLLGIDKMASGKELIMLFSVPGKYQEENGSLEFDPRVVTDHPEEWEEFKAYCDLDALLGLKLALSKYNLLSDRELAFQAVTMEMNAVGWKVDVELVEEMNRRYKENMEQAVQNFRDSTGAVNLNLNSLKQLKEWCLVRGVRATSFDEKNVEKLRKRIIVKLDEMRSMDPFHPRWKDYLDVQRLLETKQILGGSSLKKLEVILDTVGEDGRLRDQYLHIGAGQTWRTTGRSVQMQNLKRLGGEGDDMDELWQDTCAWNNDKLARNLRQVFRASQPDGQLIVGDFSSVESRGLAWLAGATWKTNAYFKGQDLYKVLASRIYDVVYVNVTKEQRQVGKVGELSCGYGAGAGAVNSFAQNMGVEFSDGEAAQLVKDWRDANPDIVQLWALLDQLLDTAITSTGSAVVGVGPGGSWRLYLEPFTTPGSLVAQAPYARSFSLRLEDPTDRTLMTRVFHGVYRKGKDIRYFKPSDRKTGDLWKDTFTDPKTKQTLPYTIYGGKLAGILTQSLCRELFFTVLADVSEKVKDVCNVELVGQFHDEIVLDWWPDEDGLERLQVENMLIRAMGQCPLNGFPMAAEIKSAYRYIK